MTNNLIRTTTYFDPGILMMLKKQAIDERRPFYAVMNDTLGSKVPGFKRHARKATQKKWRYEDVFSTFDLGLKRRKIRRSDAYE
ncbi:hypothetical protein HY086_02620 [Candidatus Gottesmanbacteria bacterium]|nr:hypothetical protein [Candidatus Gottesmanbacteria bacterium]